MSELRFATLGVEMWCTKDEWVLSSEYNSCTATLLDQEWNRSQARSQSFKNSSLLPR